MPQQVKPLSYVFRDSLQMDTIWLDVDAIPAKVFNPIDTPDLVLFNVDSAIAHQVSWGMIDTVALHKIERKDTVYQKSFFNTYHTVGKSGDPEFNPQPNGQLIMSASILIILFGSLSILYTTSKNRMVKYFLAIFDKRRFKEYFVEEHPRLLPSMPVLYLLQSLVVGSVLATWFVGQFTALYTERFIILTLIVFGGYALVPIIRNGLIMLLGNVFLIQQEARKHIFISYLSHSLLFLLVLPLAVLMAVQIPEILPYFNTILYACFGLTLSYQLLKLIQNTHLQGIRTLLYIFLYFCTLEILPLFLIYKMVSIYA